MNLTHLTCKQEGWIAEMTKNWPHFLGLDHIVIHVPNSVILTQDLQSRNDCSRMMRSKIDSRQKLFRLDVWSPSKYCPELDWWTSMIFQMILCTSHLHWSCLLQKTIVSDRSWRHTPDLHIQSKPNIIHFSKAEPSNDIWSMLKQWLQDHIYLITP